MLYASGCFSLARMSSCFRIWLGVGALAFSACSPSVSRTPFDNATPEGPDVYYYGAAGSGGKRLVEAETKTRAPVVVPKPPALVKPKPEVAAKPDPEAKESAAPSADGDLGVTPPITGIAGRYEGTDTVRIELPGVPADVQVDDAAIIDIAVVGTPKDAEVPTRYSLTVVASNTGDDLCTIEGKLSGNRLDFAADQECFTTIMGFPLEARLTGGSASFEGTGLKVEFGVAFELSDEEVSLEGRVGYVFEGQKRPEGN